MMYTCNVKLCRALGRFGCTVFITFGTLSILAQAKSGTVEFLSHPAHPYGIFDALHAMYDKFEKPDAKTLARVVRSLADA